MHQFRDFLLEFRPQHFAVSAPLHLLIATTGMWLTVNWVQKQPEKEPVWRCALCAVLLYAVSSGAIALMLYPTTMMLILAVIAWLAGSVTVVRVMFQLPDGGAGILFIYLFILVAIHSAIKAVMG